MIKKSLLVLMTISFSFATGDGVILKKAIENSYLLKEYNEKIFAITRERDSLNYSYYPSLEASYNKVHSDLKLKLNLYSGGKYEAQKSQKIFQIRQISEDIRALKSSIKFDLNKALFEKDIYSQLIEIEQKKSKLYKTVLSHINIRKSVGEKVDINSKQNSFNQSTMSIEKYKYDLDFSKLKLENMLNSKNIELSNPNFIKRLPTLNYGNREFLDKTISNHPTIKKIEYRIMELEEKNREIKSGYFPKVDAMLVTTQINVEDDKPVVNKNSAGIVIKIPFLSDYVYTKNSSLSLRARTQGLKFRLIDQRMKLREQIVMLFMNVQNSYKDLTNRDSFLAQKRREHSEYVIKRKNSTITEQLLLEKEIEYLDAKKSYLLSLLSYNVDLSNLNKSIY